MSPSPLHRLGLLSGFLGILGLTAAGPNTHAADGFLGAEQVLQRMAEAGAASDQKTNEPSPAAKLSQDLREFAGKVAGLPQADAVTGWLALADRIFALMGNPESMSGRDGSGNYVTDLLEALPPPAAWEALGQAIEARPAVKGGREIQELGLRLLGHILNGQTESRGKDLSALEALAKKAGRTDAWLFESIFLVEFANNVCHGSTEPEERGPAEDNSGLKSSCAFEFGTRRQTYACDLRQLGGGDPRSFRRGKGRAQIPP